MFLDFTRSYGKPICVALYALFSAKAMRKKPLPLLLLALTHFAEYRLVGQKVAREHGLSETEGLVQCLCFGFTWWLPLKKG